MWCLADIKLIELQVYLFSVEGRNYNYPAVSLFTDFANEQPQKAIEMLARHITINREPVRVKIWEILSQIELKGRNIPDVLLTTAIDAVRDQKKRRGGYDFTCMFLLECRDQRAADVPYDVILSIPSYIRKSRS